MNSVEIMERKTVLKAEATQMLETAKQEIRNLTDEENTRYNEIKSELEGLNEELRKLENEVEVSTEKDDKNNNNNLNIKKMEKRFSLLNAIRNVAENRQQDAVSATVLNNAAESMRGSGINYVGQIQVPLETRDILTVANEGEDTVATDLMNVLEPLRAKNVLIQAGVKFLSGLKGDVQYPVMSTINASWEGETTTTADSIPTFESIKLTPKRLSVVVPISKQFLIQDSVEAEAAIRNEIVNAINGKLEETIFSDNAGTTNSPEGLFFNGGNPLDEVKEYFDLTKMEADIEDYNLEGFKYVVSPQAKAKLRATIKGSFEDGNGTATVNVGGMVWDNNEIDGTPALTTTHVKDSNIICGAFGNMILAQWGTMDIVVDTFTLAAQGCVRLVVNSYWDFKVLREGAFKVGKLA